MQINLLDSGTIFFISDHCHVIENASTSLLYYFDMQILISKKWRDGIPQGWLARDHPSWFQSTQRLKRLERTTRGRVIPGHDEETFLALQKEKDVFT
jgi:hypothetical protein